MRFEPGIFNRISFFSPSRFLNFQKRTIQSRVPNAFSTSATQRRWLLSLVFFFFFFFFFSFFFFFFFSFLFLSFVSLFFPPLTGEMLDEGTEGWERMNGLLMKDHEFQVPLDYRNPGGKTITVFARECMSLVCVSDMPWIVYLQGGPGFPSPRPRDNSSWIRRLTRDYRVLLLDQRGTGKSTPINHEVLNYFETDRERADYLSLFRQDSIVRDCEVIREKLVGHDQKWALYGQSFGGFCILTYLSFFPHSVSLALFTGGVAPVLRTPEEVYYETYQVCLKKNQQYYEKFPNDVQKIWEVVEFVEQNEVFLPNGDRLSVRRLRSLGLCFNGTGGFESLHWLFENAFIALPNDKKNLSYVFLSQIQSLFWSFDTHPLYALLHEAIYVGASPRPSSTPSSPSASVSALSLNASGGTSSSPLHSSSPSHSPSFLSSSPSSFPSSSSPVSLVPRPSPSSPYFSSPGCSSSPSQSTVPSSPPSAFSSSPFSSSLSIPCASFSCSPSNWAANRVLELFPDFQSREKFMFTGEHVFPWMFEESAVLRPFRGTAEILAQKNDWSPIYDKDTLAKCTVPCSAAIYYEDMCVVRQFSTEVAELVPGMRCWVTKAYEHNGTSVDGEKILSKLLDLLNS